MDTAQRVLPVHETINEVSSLMAAQTARYRWFNGQWHQDWFTAAKLSAKQPLLQPEKAVSSIAFRVLDAPRLKDDYYCSVLAYCCRFRTLAVALTHRVYLWTEKSGVRYPPLPPVRQNNYVTSLAFSTDQGGKAILAVARHSGHVTLWSLLEPKARFELPHPTSACSVAFRPILTSRQSSNGGLLVQCEDLLVGDDAGRIYYYSVEWLENASGSINLLTKIEAHSQNVCGIGWSPDGGFFVSGGNNNTALLFNVDDVLYLQSLMDHAAVPGNSSPDTSSEASRHAPLRIPGVDISDHGDTFHAPGSDRQFEGHRETIRLYGSAALHSMPNTTTEIAQISRSSQVYSRGQPPTPPRSPAARLAISKNGLVDSDMIGVTNAHRFSFYHSAAVKAIAFAPWQSTLLATGGGSNDRQIHFHHTGSGTTLAVINVFAQVTSLIWSLTRREIVATFGYAQPEHDVRIAVFAWPSCECVVSIPWERKANGEVGRALWAIPYPGGPNDTAPERSLGSDVSHLLLSTSHSRRSQRPDARRDTWEHSLLPTPAATPQRYRTITDSPRLKNFIRGEGETWASRTQEEGSIIIACCDQTVKFFEVWAGKSKGKFSGLGSKAGVLGGSKILEGWCDGIAIEEIGAGEDVIR